MQRKKASARLRSRWKCTRPLKSLRRNLRYHPLCHEPNASRLVGFRLRRYFWLRRLKNQMTKELRKNRSDADRNWRRFVLFRVLFNSRFYYPVLAVLFLDLGLSATEYTLLNFAWALAIVFTDLPAGVLADRIGRKPLVVAAALFMVLEMILLGVAPLHGGIVLLLCCLANRILSGMAEGMASGADEALVFDSLAERDRSGEWPQVLDQVMRWQGVGMVIAMLRRWSGLRPRLRRASLFSLRMESLLYPRHHSSFSDLSQSHHGSPDALGRSRPARTQGADDPCRA